MATKKELQKALNDIEFALRQNNDKIDKFENSHHTLGWISSTIERINKCERIY